MCWSLTTEGKLELYRRVGAKALDGPEAAGLPSSLKTLGKRARGAPQVSSVSLDGEHFQAGAGTSADHAKGATACFLRSWCVAGYSRASHPGGGPLILWHCPLLPSARHVDAARTSGYRAKRPAWSTKLASLAFQLGEQLSREQHPHVMPGEIPVLFGWLGPSCTNQQRGAKTPLATGF